MIKIITLLIVFLKRVDFPRPHYCSKSFIIEIFKTYFTCHYCPEAIMKKFAQVTCMVINWEVLYDGPIFLGIARCQEKGSIFCKHRRTEEAKTKVYISVYKIFTNSFLKIYAAIARVKSLQIEAKLRNSIISVHVILVSDIVPTSQTRSVLRPRAILPSTDSKNSCYFIITKRTYN